MHLLPEGSKDRVTYTRKGTIGNWTSIKETFEPCEKCPFVSTEQLKQHNTIDNLWTAVRGVVFDVTQYAYYHPGGAEELLRGAGRDCTDLFNEYHPWVAERAYMSKNQEIGTYVVSNTNKSLISIGKSLSTGSDKATFISSKAISIVKYNYNSFIYKFELESPYELYEGQHVKFIGGSGQPIMRSYTPISPLNQTRVFEFIIKLYETGKMSRYLKKLKEGDKLKIKILKTNKYYRSKDIKYIGMIAAGTGIAPMIQIIQKVIKDNLDIEMTLLFSNVLEEDILLRERLEILKSNGKNFNIHYVLTNAKENWTGLKGRIDKSKIQEFLPKPSGNTQILVCGPIAMTNAMELLLNDVGYSDSMIYLFL